MTNLISPIEAFNSMLLRKKVLARFKNSGSDLDFVDIKTLPADVFIDSDYEFCIQKEMVELSGYNFTKPLNFTDVQNGQEIFIVMPTCILHTKYDSEHSDICKSIEHGFVQADIENAKLQITAIAKTFGFYVEEIEVKEGFEEKPKRQRKPRETKITAVDDEINEALETSEKKKTLAGITITEQGPINVVEENLVSETSPNISTNNHQEILNDLIDRASKAQSPAEANALFKYTKGWTQEQSAPLHAAVSRRLAELPQPEAKEPPSLLVRIQKAADLTELDALEIDVSARDLKIVPILMAEVYKRRKQLEAPIDLTDEAFP